MQAIGAASSRIVNLPVERWQSKGNIRPTQRRTPHDVGDLKEIAAPLRAAGKLRGAGEPTPAKPTR